MNQNLVDNRVAETPAGPPNLFDQIPPIEIPPTLKLPPLKTLPRGFTGPRTRTRTICWGEPTKTKLPDDIDICWTLIPDGGLIGKMIEVEFD